jgi:lipopolysaccharide transport system ATP-binding protein
VAAHLEPEILVVDEVLAVGDAEFQKKCLGKMGEVSSRDGRTVLFVSHQLGMVSRLCTRGIVLASGRVDYDGPVDIAIERHLAAIARREADEELDHPRLGALDFAIARVEVLGASGAPADQLPWDQPFGVRVRLILRKPISGQVLVVALDSQRGGRVASWATPLADLVAGGDTAEITLGVSPRILAPGGYSVTVAVVVPHTAILHMVEAVCPLVVIDTGSDMTAVSGIDYGVALIPAAWSADQGAVSRMPAAAVG